MASTPIQFRVPISVQVGLVAAMFVAALVVLWAAGSAAMQREQRRSEAKNLLVGAGDVLVEQGRGIIAQAGDFLLFPDDRSRADLDDKLRARARQVLSQYKDIQGGYWVLTRFRSFLGTVRLEPEPASKGTEDAEIDPASPSYGRGESSLPPLERDLIDIQVDAAIRKQQKLFSVEELTDGPPVTVAIRTAPVMVDKRVVGATWVMTRLVDPLFLDPSIQGYRLAAGLALGGIGLAFVLTVGLARTVRRQAVERDRLQTDLRRSERLAALGKLLAGVAHEVRNPLAGIRSTAQLWQRGVVGLDAESLGGLVHEVDRLEEIVSRLLQFSRADAAGPGPWRPERAPGRGGPTGRGAGRGEGSPGRSRSRESLAACCDGPAGPAASLPKPDDQRDPGHVDRRNPPTEHATGPDPSRDPGQRGRHRSGVSTRGIEAHLRAVLHDQGRGNWAGIGHCPRNRPGPPRRPPGR